MKQPEGFIKEGEEHLVCMLKKCICGLNNRIDIGAWISTLTSRN